MTGKFDLETLKTLNRLVDEALALPPANRVTWLGGLTVEYDAFKPRLKAMLDALAAPEFEAFLESMPAIDVDAPEETESGGPALAAGDLVGAYRLARPLARGGQGVVWLAERADGLLERAVAIKLPVGLAHRPGLAERLAREREILGRLEHPHIARLYDAGLSAAGEPYLAMEFVDGRTLDVYVVEEQLDARAIVRLLLQVASAVAYAHGALVIHRDLKPSNVLVGADGRARLLDFGIAALVDAHGAERDGLTEDGGRALTLAYASPEQIERRPLGVATDVYSLGVLAYELLAGRRPYTPARETAGALEDAVLYAEPEVPSRVAVGAERRRALAGDLDTILLKALRKVPAERYASVAGLADDLERWLDGRPVLAQPDRWTYRARKFLVRHRLPVTAAAAVTLAVGIGGGTAAWQARQARLADAQAASAEVFISSMLRHANIDAPESQSDLLVVDLLRRARSEVQALQAPPPVRVRLLNLVADGLRGFGQAAEYDDATAQAEAEARAGLPPDHPEALRAGYLRAHALMQRGKAADAAVVLGPVIARMETRPEADALTFVRAQRLRADIAMGDVKYTDAQAAARQAVAVAERQLGPAHAETATALRTLGEALMHGDATEEALAVSARALEATLQAHAARPNHPDILRARELRAGVLADAGDLEAAVGELERALAVKMALQGPDSKDVGISTHNLSGNQYRLGRLADAVANNERALTGLADHLDPEAIDYVNIRNLRALLMVSVRRGRAAIEAAERGQAANTKLLGATHPQTLVNRAVAALGHGYDGRTEPARRQMAAVVDDMRTTGTAVPAVLLMAGRLSALAGARAEAARQLDEAAAAAGTAPAAARLVAQISMERALLVQSADAAVAAIDAALAGLDTLYPVPTPWQADGHLALARLLHANGRGHDAETHAQTAAEVWRTLNPESRWLAEAERLARRQ